MAEPTPPPPPPRTDGGWKVKMKFLGIGALLGLLVGGAGAGKVYLDLSGQVDALELKQASAESREAVLAARAAVAAAAVALSAENFGSAKDKVAAARLKLRGLNAETAALDAEVLQTVSQRLDGINIVVGGSNASAVSGLNEVGLALDRLMGLE